MFWLICLISAWCIFHAILHLLQFRDPSALARYGLEVKPFFFKATFTRFNHLWLSIVRCIGQRILTWWFRIGSFVTLCSLPYTIYLLVNILIQSFSSQSEEGPSLQAILPGVNIPISDIGLYLFAIVTSSIIHEAGHALAAASSGIRVEGCGFIIFVIIPIFFVEMNTGSYSSAKPGKRLAVVSAGVWHNVVLSLLCLLFTFVILPFLLSPLCQVGGGVTVVSSNNEPGSLKAGDIIHSINNCLVNRKEDWKKCLISVTNQKTFGFCIPRGFVDENQHSTPQLNKVNSSCCPANDQKGICFTDESRTKYCLPARKVVEEFSHKNCSTYQDCFENGSCLKVQAEDDSTKLLWMTRKNQPHYLFYGFPSQVYGSTRVLDCQLIASWCPVNVLHIIQEAFKFVASFSLALGVLNVVPCFFLDGQYILSSALEYWATLPELRGRQIEQRKINQVVRIISTLGFVLIATCVIKAGVSLLGHWDPM